jgi:hypothetical protein
MTQSHHRFPKLQREAVWIGFLLGLTVFVFEVHFKLKLGRVLVGLITKIAVVLVVVFDLAGLNSEKEKLVRMIVVFTCN